MKFFKFIGIIILLIIIAIIIYTVYLVVSYQINKGKYVEVAQVQGTTNGYVPQGLAYSEKYDVILQTSYSKNQNNSKLFVIDFKTGKCLKELKLNNNDGTINTSHVGGIATNNELVWITSDYIINKYDIDEIVTTKKDYINSLDDIKINNKGDFCTYNNRVLWIGEFTKSTLFTNDKPILNGYIIDSKEDYKNPKYSYELPSRVQGMAVLEDGKFLYSRSYTGFIQSNLSIYDSNKRISKKIIPSMSEGIFVRNNEVYVLFESATDSYTVVYPKMKKIIKLNID